MRPRGPHSPATQQPHRGGWKRKTAGRPPFRGAARASGDGAVILYGWHTVKAALENPARRIRDRKSTRLNSSHSQISYAVFCLKKKKNNKRYTVRDGRWSRLNSTDHRRGPYMSPVCS